MASLRDAPHPEGIAADELPRRVVEIVYVGRRPGPLGGRRALRPRPAGVPRPPPLTRTAPFGAIALVCYSRCGVGWRQTARSRGVRDQPGTRGRRVAVENPAALATKRARSTGAQEALLGQAALHPSAARCPGLALSLLRRRDFQQVVTGVWVHRDGIDDLDADSRRPGAAPRRSVCKSPGAQPRCWDFRCPITRSRTSRSRKPEDRRYRAEIKPHVTSRPRRVIVVRGIRTTDPVATFIDCAGSLSLVELVVLGDALVKRYDVSADELLEACRASDDYYAGLGSASRGVRGATASTRRWRHAFAC